METVGMRILAVCCGMDDEGLKMLELRGVERLYKQVSD